MSWETVYREYRTATQRGEDERREREYAQVAVWHCLRCESVQPKGVGCQCTETKSEGLRCRSS
jgi:hypothetical protein